LPPPCASLRIRGISRPSARWRSSPAPFCVTAASRFSFPLLALFLGDIFIGFHKLMFVVYASFLRQRCHRPLAPRSPHHRPHHSRHPSRRHPVFHVTNFAVWGTRGFLSAHRCRPRNLLCGWRPVLLETPSRRDAFYVALLFGGFPLAERFSPALQRSSQRVSS